MGERPALLDCIESEAKIETIKFLIENGADVNIKNQFGDSLAKRVEIHRNNPEWMATVKGLLPKDPPPIAALSRVLDDSDLESLKCYFEFEPQAS